MFPSLDADLIRNLDQAEVEGGFVVLLLWGGWLPWVQLWVQLMIKHVGVDLLDQLVVQLMIKGVEVQLITGSTSGSTNG